MIYLVRHGQTDWNFNKKIQGQTDIPLNENGQMQAKKTSENISKYKIERIISSDLSRAKETAEIINEKIGLNIELDERLREVEYGDYEGKCYGKFTEEDWNKFNRDPEIFNGEPRYDVYKRVKSFFDELDDDKNILIVTHGGIIRMMKYFEKNRENFNFEEYLKFTKGLKIDNSQLVKFEVLIKENKE